MSEHDLPALPRNPHWLMNEPDMWPPLGAPRRDDRPGRDGAPARTGAQARPGMPTSPRSGYEEILAARAVMRTRVERATPREWRTPIDVAPAAVATPERLPEPPMRRVQRRR